MMEVPGKFILVFQNANDHNAARVDFPPLLGFRCRIAHVFVDLNTDYC